MASFPTASADKDGLQEEARRAIEQRRAILGPCLAAMGFSEYGAAPPALPEALRFDGVDVPLEPWERNVLLGQSAGDSATLLAHLAEGIAFRALGAHRLHQLDSSAALAGGTNGAAGELVEEFAVGLALQQEIQRDIDRLVGKGEMGDAKKLTCFRRKIDQTLGKLDRHLDPNTREQAQVRSAGLLTPRGSPEASRRRLPPPVETGLSLEDLTALEKQIDREISSRPQAPTPEELFEAGLREQESGESETATTVVMAAEAAPPAARRFRVLLTILALCAVVYPIFLILTSEQAPPPRLGMEHFQHIEAVLDVKPRPPSLFVRVDLAKWSALPAEERLQVVGELGRIAGGEGYSGVQVKNGAGATVGQWLRKTGARLIESPKVAS